MIWDGVRNLMASDIREKEKGKGNIGTVSALHFALSSSGSACAR